MEGEKEEVAGVFTEWWGGAGRGKAVVKVGVRGGGGGDLVMRETTM